MSAYNDLIQACTVVNSTLARNGSEYSFRVQNRNGYRALDQYKNDSCLRTIATGTPQKCRAALFENAFDLLTYKLDSLPRNDTLAS